jgi:hypothetical protein
MPRTPLWIATAALLACASTPDRHARYTSLSAESRDLYEKYGQFLTESQKDRFLALPDDEARKQFIADLHVEERLAKYPRHVQDAIWKKEIVPGMDGEAVLLSWGSPDEIERKDPDEAKGVSYEKWIYRKGSVMERQGTREVWMVNGLVSDVTR